MSQQRVCDLDGTIIASTDDDVYTVTSGRTGKSRDVCAECARAGAANVPLWTAATQLAKGARVKPTTGNGFVYEVVTEGATAATEPTWPTVKDTSLVDGGVRYRTRKIPNQNAVLRKTMPGQTTTRVTLGSWVEGAEEVVSN
jgi:hypothetical protein